MKPKLTKKYKLALETAQLHGISTTLDRESLYTALKHDFTWYPALKQWLSNDKYFREAWGILPAFQPVDRKKAQEQGLYTIYELHKRAKTVNGNRPDAVIRWGNGHTVDELFSITKAVPYIHIHPEYGELPCYRFWDFIPEHLKTKTQIRKTDKKRRPKQHPKAVCDTRWEDGKYDRGGVYLLYDIRECLDKTLQSEKQKQAFAQVRAEHTCSRCGQPGIKPSSEGLCSRCQKRRDKERAFDRMLVKERNNAVLWAQKLFQTGFVVLDTETTGLDSDARIVEIAIIDGVSGNVLVDTLINPGIPIPPEASAVHGILDQDVEDKPMFEEIRGDVKQALKDKVCVIYKEAYDRPLLETHGVNTQAHTFDCAMEMYAQFYGEWSDYWESFRWQSLTAAVRQCDLHVSGTAHHALGDCQTTRAVIAYMARQKLKEGQNYG